MDRWVWGGGRKERRRRVCGAKMTEIRDGDTTSKGAATAARSEGETERSRAAEQREKDAAPSSESGQKGEGRMGSPA